MNADLLGMKLYYSERGRSMSGILKRENGKHLTDKEARAFIDYCIEQGYKDLYSCPEFDEVKDKLNL